MFIRLHVCNLKLKPTKVEKVSFLKRYYREFRIIRNACHKRYLINRMVLRKKCKFTITDPRQGN